MASQIELARQAGKLGHLEDGDPGELGAQMAALARRYPHVNVWGGCCGTDGRHIDQITRQVSEARREVVGIDLA